MSANPFAEKQLSGTATVSITVNHDVSDAQDVLVPLGSSSSTWGARKKDIFDKEKCLFFQLNSLARA